MTSEALIYSFASNEIPGLPFKDGSFGVPYITNTWD